MDELWVALVVAIVAEVVAQGLWRLYDRWGQQMVTAVVEFARHCISMMR